MASEERLYRVNFVNQDKVYEVYVRHVYQSDMWGFIQLEDFVFGNRSELLVDPGEEKLKQEFADVNTCYVPMQAIIRIDEVKNEGVARISEAKGNIAAFPLTPPRKDK
ncbi:DUF1820 family protein [Marinobacterium sediminicola]|uniref:DUF1820 family protein n=1 Tax=Marinobacterium sediminicola TaxID=518898 RepID=A0ABY1S0A7_9GAMM|nr:DUF1820 family protein [Marinobacterium sediminicola]ULG69655.1 DUF1820 family protein [Marinobacterium sediminicola]SMR74617.1 hypothetical protein SAMN04487964_10781 [Marinobacterium sediminicola]